MEQPKSKIRIIIADDLTLFVELLERLFVSDKNYIIVGMAKNGKELLQILNRTTPDLILLDINMPLLNGMETALEIKKRYSEIKIIFISAYYSQTIRRFCIENHINGYISKSTEILELRDCINRVIAGEYVYLIASEPEPENQVFEDSFYKKLKITPREAQVIQLLSRGQSSKQIAESLSLKFNTVETHRKNILDKLNVPNVAALVSFMNENKL